MQVRLIRRAAVVAALACIAAPLDAVRAQLRVVNHNITNYAGGKGPDIQTAYYGIFEGRSVAPDVFIAQEFTTAAAVTAFKGFLNTAPGSPGDWEAAPFVNGPDTDDAFFYRTSKVDFLGSTIVSAGGSAPNPPRNTLRYDISLHGYAPDIAVIACYGSHMKAGSTSGDQARRLVEAQRIRDNAETLPVAWHFLFGADTNIQSSTQLAYVEFVGTQSNNAGRFFDPIATPGSWNNNSGFRFVHTQDPADPTGGMDDRHDQILVSGDLVDGTGLDYIGNATIPYSTTTWNDPNHSYRAWGNDGTSYNQSLRTTGNAMVGPDIAQALINLAAGLGHLPVFLDLRVPAKIDSPLVLDFGQVPVGAVAELTLTVSNAGDTALWTAAGIDDLNYSLSAGAGFAAQAGPFVDPAGGGGNDHTISMDTSLPGMFNTTLSIISDAPEQPLRLVQLTGEVVAASCQPGDSDCDGDVDLDDYAAFDGCLTGPIGGPLYTPPTQACTDSFDVDADDDVDLYDFAAFSIAFTG
jgi:hypothetical protein